MFNMNKWVSVSAVLLSLSAPSISRSWVGVHDQEYNIKNEFDHKSWLTDPSDGSHHRSNHGWSSDFDTKEEDFWGSKDDYGDYAGHGYGNDRFDHFRNHHNHDGHKFDHHNHGDYEYHHNHHGFNHQGHGPHDYDSKHDYIGHHSQSKFPVAPSFALPQNNQGIVRDNQANPMVLMIPMSQEQNTRSPAKPGLPQNGQNREQFSRNNADRVIFPDSQISNLSPTRSPPPPAPTPVVSQNPSTVPPSLPIFDIVICIRACPITPEFNPVCGTNNVTYNNLGALECTKNCGVNVALSRRAPCPQPLPPSFHISVPMISTETPIVNARAGEKNDTAPITKRSAVEQISKLTSLPSLNVEPARKRVV